MGLLAAFVFFIIASEGAADARTLAGMVFVPKASDVIARAALPRPQSAIDASRVPALGTPGAQKALGQFLGKIIDKPLLDGLRDAVQAYFATLQQPFVTVVIPAQDITDGVLQVVVTQGRLGTVRVAGNKWFDAAQYRDAIQTRPGQLLDDRQLAADVDSINRNPFRHASLEATAGQATGTTDLTIRVQDRRPVAYTATADNSGNPATGLARLGAALDWGNAFGRGDDLNLGYTTSASGTSVQQYSFGYTAMLRSNADLSLTATTASERTVVTGPLSTTGVNTGVSLRYVMPLRATSSSGPQFSFGADYKSSNSNLLFGGASVFPTTSTIYQLALGLASTLKDRSGSTSGRLALFVSPGNVGANNTDAAFSAQQAGALAGYVYGNIGIERAPSLGSGATWAVHVRAQWSSANLLSSEQLAFGGVSSIRGFTTAFAARDEGVLVSTELSSRPLAGAITLQPLVFVDYGVGWNHQNIGGVNTYIQMLSVGPGLSYQIRQHLSGRVDYGFVLQHIGLPAPGGQADMSIQARY